MRVALAALMSETNQLWRVVTSLRHCDILLFCETGKDARIVEVPYEDFAKQSKELAGMSHVLL